MKLFLENLKNTLDLDEDLPFKIRSVTPIPSVIRKRRLQPGNMYVMQYKGKEYSVVVISTSRSSSGTYRAMNTGNILLTCIKFDLTSIQDQMILLGIYKKQKAASYKVTQDKATDLESLVSTNTRLLTKKEQENLKTELKNEIEDFYTETDDEAKLFADYFTKIQNQVRLKVTLSLFGKNNFRTFIVNSIDDAHYLSLSFNANTDI